MRRLCRASVRARVVALTRRQSGRWVSRVPLLVLPHEAVPESGRHRGSEPTSSAILGSGRNRGNDNVFRITGWTAACLAEGALHEGAEQGLRGCAQVGRWFDPSAIWLVAVSGSETCGQHRQGKPAGSPLPYGPCAWGAQSPPDEHRPPAAAGSRSDSTLGTHRRGASRAEAARSRSDGVSSPRGLRLRTSSAL